MEPLVSFHLQIYEQLYSFFLLPKWLAQAWQMKISGICSTEFKMSSFFNVHSVKLGQDKGAGITIVTVLKLGSIFACDGW